MEIQNTLGLKIPERTAAPAGSFLLNPKEVSAWVGSLPMANVGETSRQVFKTIVEFNRLDIPNLSRIKIAELFRSPIQYISGNLHKYYFDAPFPLSAKNRKIAVLNRELYTELALAYKVFIETMISGRAGKFDRKLLIIAIHRVMRFLSMVIYQSVIVYDPIPATVWKEIHRLYAYAEQNNIQDLPVKDGTNDNAANTIADLYKQILLFSISAPYRMRQREIEQIMGSLQSWGSLANLEAAEVSSLTPYQFVTRLASDSPPMHNALETKELSNRCRILNTQPLVQSLRESFDKLPTESGGSEVTKENLQLSKHLLRQLIQVFSSAPKREFVRTKLNFELKIATGITAIHSLLTIGKEPEETGVEQQPDNDLDWVEQPTGNILNRQLYTVTEQKLTLDGYDESIQETIIASSVGYPGLGQSSAPTWASNQVEQQVETFACKTINESAGGYCINWQGLNAPKIKIGEVIGIQSATNKNQFGIGISRWLRNIPGHGLQLGMQMISPSSTAVQIRHLDDNDLSSNSQKGLLLPELKSSEQPASLILPTLPFKVGDLIMVIDGNGERKAKLTRLLETTGAFTQFQFTYLSVRAIDEDSQQSTTNPDFDNIWSML